MTDWFTTRTGIYDQVWQQLAQPQQLVTLATQSPDGWPEARTVVLRSADKIMRKATMHTDVTSAKWQSLAANNKIALHLWLAELDLQIRVQGHAERSSGAPVRALWAQIPDHSRQSYGVVPSPGTAIESALSYVKSPDPATFGVISCTMTHIDAVYLGAQHRRVAYHAGNNWDGTWLAP